MTSTFHIQDSATGSFYKSYACGGYTPRPSFEYAKRGLGKKFTDMGKVKMHLLYLVGGFNPGPRYQAMNALRRTASKVELERIDRQQMIYQALNPGYFNLPDWLSNSRPLDDLPPTWRIVENIAEVDGTTKLVVDFSIPTYIETFRRLRGLTDRYGSAVKDLYKKLESKGKLAKFDNIAVVSTDFDAMSDNDLMYAGDDDTSDAARIATILKDMGAGRSDVMRATIRATTALAFDSLAQALQFKFAYDGPYQVTLLDLSTLTEVVDEKAVA